MSRRIMIDLETLGSTPGCSIVAIGAAASDRDGYVVDRFYMVVNRQSCRNYGLFEEQATLDWWSQQSEAARCVLEYADSPAQSWALDQALEALNRFVAGHPGSEVYGNGSDFDNAILAAAARAVGVQLAWPFWQNRCYRTLKARAPHVPLDRKGTHHNALDDAITQAQHLGQIERALRLSSSQVAKANAFIGWMADRYQQQTAKRICGVKICNRLSREWALDCARATFDAIDLDEPYGHPSYDWDRDMADELVDEDL